MDVISGPAGQLASDEDREWAVGSLRSHHAAGRLTVTEFEARMSNTYTARTVGELRDQFDNLPMPVSVHTSDGHQPGMPPPVSSSGTIDPSRMLRRQDRHSRGLLRRNGSQRQLMTEAVLLRHLIFYAVLSTFIFGIWVLSGTGHRWFLWPVLGWGFAVVMHIALVFGKPSRIET